MASTSRTAQTTQTTALPGIRDLFPDHLFEAQQRRELAINIRPKDPFLAHASSVRLQAHTTSDGEREMQREAFKALTAPFPRSPALPHSSYVERGGFMFPPSTTARVPPSTQPPSALNFVPSSAVPPSLTILAPGRVTASPTFPGSSTSDVISSSPVVRTQTERPRRRGHVHTYSSDASAAAASLLNLSLSSGPLTTASTSPTVTNDILGQRANVEQVGNDDESMFVFEMDEATERTKRRAREADEEQGDEGMEVEGVETAPTSVDSHIGSDAKQARLSKDLTIEHETGSNSKTAAEPDGKGSGEVTSSAENGNMGEHEPTSSAENETGEGEAEGDGDGGDGKRHTCPHCKKRFNRPSSLKIHLNTHTGAKPFECPYPGCGRQFNVSSNMRRHYRNHSSPAGLGPGAAPGLGIGLGMGMHEPFGPRSMLGLHAGPPSYPGPQFSHIQLERERIQRERLAMHGPSREPNPQYGPPSAYRPPPHTNGVPLPVSHPPRIPPPPGIHHGVPYGSYPSGFGPRESELDRRERLTRLERDNWEIREREIERERMGRLERRPLPSQAPIHPAYSHHSSTQLGRTPDYRTGGGPGQPFLDHVRYPQPPARSRPSSLVDHDPPPTHPQPQQPHPVQLHSQARHPAAGPIPVLRSSHSFSHLYASPLGHRHSRSSPSHSHSHSRERHSSKSPIVSPALSAASSLPVQGWRGHAHTHSAPAFDGLGRTRGVELPPLMTSIRSPYNRDVALPAGHGRSHSYSASGNYIGPGPTFIPPFNLGRDEERNERRARRDSTAALTGHESDREVMQGAMSDFESEDRREESDVEMHDAIGGRVGRIRPPSPALGAIGSPLHPLSPTFQRRTPPPHSMELRRRPSNPQSVMASGTSSSRDRAFSQPHPHYAHSRTGSGSSSGHGHGYTSHPYARARHAHSQSREVAVVAADAVSPRLRASLSTSPKAQLPNTSTSVSPRASISSGMSPGPLQNGVNTDARPVQEPEHSDRVSKLSSPISASGHTSRFPVYTFPPPAPPPGVVIPTNSPVGSVTMEVEN
ncbi:hypothetical protein ACEPAI_6606 [Sanghuangporus weigelae]